MQQEMQDTASTFTPAPLTRLTKRVSHLMLVLALTGCVSGLQVDLHDDTEQPVVRGSHVRRNRTPMDRTLSCLGEQLQTLQQPPLSIGVGEVRDYSGRFSTNEGNVITQGGSLMVFSALGKIGPSIQIHERFDTRVAEQELGYLDRRQLGDGKGHAVDSSAESKTVPYLPYFGGSILKSAYYIVGGITEVNYNISSGGVETSISNIGYKNRLFVMNVAVDLRLVNTSTLVVERTVSLQKQIIGEEVGFNIFRFFENELIDINAGGKLQEPLQLGVRTTIEQGVYDLIEYVARLPRGKCMALSGPYITKPRSPVTQHEGKPQEESPWNRPRPDAASSKKPVSLTEPSLPPAKPAAVAVTEQNPPPTKPVAVAVSEQSPPPAKPAVTPAPPEPPAINASVSKARQFADFDLEFQPLETSLDAAAKSKLDSLSSPSAGQVLRLVLVSRESESLPPEKRHELARQRAQLVVDLLQSRGIPPERINLQWLINKTEPYPVRHTVAGYQRLAVVLVKTN